MTRLATGLVFGLLSACAAQGSAPPTPDRRPAESGAAAREPMDLPPAPSASSAASAPREETKFELEDEIDALRAPIRTAVAAEVSLGDVRLAIIWPAFRPDGTILDNDIDTHPFHRVDGAWKADPGLGRRLRDASSITQLIGGEGWTIVRTCGLPLEQLTTEIPRSARAFDDAHRAKDLDAALAAYVRLTRAFSFAEVAYTHDITRFLITRLLIGSRWTCDEAAKTCTVDTVATTYEEPEKDGTTRSRDVKAVHATFALEDCGGGRVVGAPLR